MEWLERTELLVGKDKIKILQKSNILVVGLGGVGAYAAEQLCRAGIGKMTMVDGDVVETSNRNRQLPATISTTGKAKTEILAKRFRDINPDIELTLYHEFIKDQRINELLKDKSFDYVVDAIDTLSPKVFLIYEALKLGFKVISSMGAGGRMNPSLVQVSDMSKSYNCRLAKMLRKRLSKLGVKNGVKVVFSTEQIQESAVRLEEGQNKKSTVGTISYMPPVFGCFIASTVIRDLLQP